MESLFLEDRAIALATSDSTKWSALGIQVWLVQSLLSKTSEASEQKTRKKPQIFQTV